MKRCSPKLTPEEQLCLVLAVNANFELLVDKDLKFLITKTSIVGTMSEVFARPDNVLVHR